LRRVCTAVKAFGCGTRRGGDQRVQEAVLSDLESEVPHDAVDGVNGCSEGEDIQKVVVGRSRFEIVDGCLAICVSRSGSIRYNIMS
jgi:hypothetical protein